MTISDSTFSDNKAQGLRQLRGRQAAQLVVDQRQQLFSGLWVALLDR
jgi:hypothetical protein